MVLIYETKLIDGNEWKVVIESDDPKLKGAYKCQCGQIIKNVKNLNKHLQQPSHDRRLLWLMNNRPPTYRLLPPV